MWQWGAMCSCPSLTPLTRLKAAAPGAKEEQFAKIHKAGDTDIIVTVIPPDDLKALPSVDVREYVDSETYTGPTKKGFRFAWDKLTEFIGLLEAQARQLGSGEKAKPILFTDAHPSWVKDAEKAGVDKGAWQRLSAPGVAATGSEGVSW